MQPLPLPVRYVTVVQELLLVSGVTWVYLQFVGTAPQLVPLYFLKFVNFLKNKGVVIEVLAHVLKCNHCLK